MGGTEGEGGGRKDREGKSAEVSNGWVGGGGGEIIAVTDQLR